MKKIKDQVDNERFIFGGIDCCEIIGISRQGFGDYKTPALKKVGKMNYYDIRDVVKERIDRRDRSTNQGSLQELNDNRARKELASAQKIELEVEEMKGNLIKSDVVAQIFSEIAAGFKSKIVGLESTLPPKILNLENINLVREAVKEEVIKILEELNKNVIDEIFKPYENIDEEETENKNEVK